MFYKEEDDKEGEDVASEDSSDDELAVAVLRIQKEENENEEEPSRRQQEKEELKGTELAEKECEEERHENENVEVKEKRKMQLPSVSEVFASVSPQFTLKKKSEDERKDAIRTPLDRVSASRSNPTIEAEPAVSSTKALGLPDEGHWHVPLTAFDIMKSKKKTLEDERRQKEKEVMRRKKEADMVKKKRPISELEKEDKSLTIKERERIKRSKGQSSQANWKPEAWMKLRQEFD